MYGCHGWLDSDWLTLLMAVRTQPPAEPGCNHYQRQPKLAPGPHRALEAEVLQPVSVLPVQGDWIGRKRRGQTEQLIHLIEVVLEIITADHLA